MKALKDRFPELYLIGDVCMCEYTSHGHCGILKGQEVDNDETLSYLARIALSQVQAGADMVAPSDMMDGRVAAIRAALDREGYTGVPIMSYAVKYASSFYGPFREAADSAPAFGDRRSYQMDFHNVREGLREARLDVEEGADIIMVKPAMGLRGCHRQSPGGGAGAGGLLQRQRGIRHGEVRGPSRSHGRGAAHLRAGRFGLPGGKRCVSDLFCPGTGPVLGRREAGVIDTLCGTV